MTHRRRAAVPARPGAARPCSRSRSRSDSRRPDTGRSSRVSTEGSESTCATPSRTSTGSTSPTSTSSAFGWRRRRGSRSRPTTPQGPRARTSSTGCPRRSQAAERLGPRYDAVVVDEAQDFRAWWWPALLSLHSDPDEGLLYVFADDDQNLYGGTLRSRRRTTSARSATTCGTPRRSGVRLGLLRGRREADLARARRPTRADPRVRGRRGAGPAARDRAPHARRGGGRPARGHRGPHAVGRRQEPAPGSGSVDGFRLSSSVEPGSVLATSVHAFKGSNGRS